VKVCDVLIFLVPSGWHLRQGTFVRRRLCAASDLNRFLCAQCAAFIFGLLSEQSAGA
jgi:hypothetical protein